MSNTTDTNQLIT